MSEKNEISAVREWELALDDFEQGLTHHVEGEDRNAVIRLYYAVLHGIRALLKQADPTFSAKTHRGVLAEFSRRWIKEGPLDRKWSRIFQNMKTDRELAEYTGDIPDKQIIEETIEHGRKFLSCLYDELPSDENFKNPERDFQADD